MKRNFILLIAGIAFPAINVSASVIPSGYQAEKYADNANSREIEYAIFDPEMEDPTSEVPLIVFEGLSEGMATNLVETLRKTDIPAYVFYFDKQYDSLPLSELCRDKQIDPDRIYLISNSQLVDRGDFAAQLIYNPKSMEILSWPTTYIFTTPNTLTDFASTASGIPGYASTDVNIADDSEQDEKLTNLYMTEANTFAITVNGNTEAEFYIPLVLYWLTSQSKTE